MGIYKKISYVFTRIILKTLILLIVVYRFCISPFIASRCRYFPTCSEYALESLKTHGILKGLYISVRRLARCQPLSKKDYFDPVPIKTKGLKN